MEGDATVVAVTKGTAEVSPTQGKPLVVSAGQYTTVPPKAAATPPHSLQGLEWPDMDVSLALKPRIITVDQDPTLYLKGIQYVEVAGLVSLRPVDYVEFYVDGAVQYMANVQPFRFKLDTRGLSDGDHTLSATVRWQDQGQMTTDELKVKVYNADLPSASPSPSPSSSPSPAASAASTPR